MLWFKKSSSSEWQRRYDWFFTALLAIFFKRIFLLDYDEGWRRTSESRSESHLTRTLTPDLCHKSKSISTPLTSHCSIASKIDGQYNLDTHSSVSTNFNFQPYISSKTKAMAQRLICSFYTYNDKWRMTFHSWRLL